MSSGFFIAVFGTDATLTGATAGGDITLVALGASDLGTAANTTAAVVDAGAGMIPEAVEGAGENTTNAVGALEDWSNVDFRRGMRRGIVHG